MVRRRVTLLPSQRVAGLTLLELMVVLVILAIVATVAVQSLQPQVDNQRFESASQLLNEIKAAALGPQEKYQLDGTPLVSGFVADVGCFPLVGNDLDLDSENLLSELWDPDNELGRKFPYQFRPGPNQPVDYSKIRIPCGWRGPYLQLPIGSSSVRDPWGRPLQLFTDNDGTLNEIQIEVPDNPNLVNFPPLSVGLATGKVEVTGKVLLDNPDNATVRVALLTPDPQSSLTTLVAMDDEDEQPDSFMFQQVPIGLRVVVVDVDGQRKTKYVQVTHGGSVLCFDFQTRESDTQN